MRRFGLASRDRDRLGATRGYREFGIFSLSAQALASCCLRSKEDSVKVPPIFTPPVDQEPCKPPGRAPWSCGVRRDKWNATQMGNGIWAMAGSPASSPDVVTGVCTGFCTDLSSAANAWPGGSQKAGLATHVPRGGPR